jgi:hypothetical protein
MGMIKEINSKLTPATANELYSSREKDSLLKSRMIPPQARLRRKQIATVLRANKYRPWTRSLRERGRDSA